MRTTLASAVTIVALLVSTEAFAQQPPAGQGHQQEHQQHQQQQPASPPAQAPAPSPGGMGGMQGGMMHGQGGGMHSGGMHAGGMHGGMMGGGMCGMMGGGMMGGGMMGGMGQMMGAQADPKTLGRMLQMRGEVMKAVGDVLIKHGHALEAAPAR